MPAEVACRSAEWSSMASSSGKVEPGGVDAGGDVHRRAEHPGHAAAQAEGALEVGGYGTAQAEVGPRRCADQPAEDLAVDVDAARPHDVGEQGAVGERGERPTGRDRGAERTGAREDVDPAA